MRESMSKASCVYDGDEEEEEDVVVVVVKDFSVTKCEIAGGAEEQEEQEDGGQNWIVAYCRKEEEGRKLRLGLWIGEDDDEDQDGNRHWRVRGMNGIVEVVKWEQVVWQKSFEYLDFQVFRKVVDTIMQLQCLFTNNLFILWRLMYCHAQFQTTHMLGPSQYVYDLLKRSFASLTTQSDENVFQLAVFITLVENNQFFQLAVCENKSKLACGFKAKTLIHLDVDTRKQVLNWFQAFEKASNRFVFNRDKKLLIQIIGKKTINTIIQFFWTVLLEKALFNVFEYGKVDDPVNPIKGMEICGTKQYFLACEIMNRVYGENLRRSTILEFMLRTGILTAPRNNLQMEMRKWNRERKPFTKRMLAQSQQIIHQNPFHTHRISFENTTFAIDSNDTIEVDDSFGLGDNPNQLVVHIADIARLFLQHGFQGEIFKTALSRQSTIYLCEQKDLMLPQSYVKEASLDNTKQPNYAITVKFTVVDEQNEQDWGLVRVNDIQVCRSIVKKPIRMNFKQADEILKNHQYMYHQQLNQINRLADILKRRVQVNPNNGYELKMSVTHYGKKTKPMPPFNITTDILDCRSTSRQLVEIIMLAANHAFGVYADMKQIPILYRNLHYTNGIQYRLATGKQIETWKTNGVEISTKVGMHEQLNISHYVQLTSPLRRAIDLIGQMQLSYGLLGIQAEQFQSVEQLNGYRPRWMMHAEQESQCYWIFEDLLQKGHQNFIHAITKQQVVNIEEHAYQLIEIPRYNHKQFLMNQTQKLLPNTPVLVSFSHVYPRTWQYVCTLICTLN